MVFVVCDHDGRLAVSEILNVLEGGIILREIDNSVLDVYKRQAQTLPYPEAIP